MRARLRSCLNTLRRTNDFIRPMRIWFSLFLVWGFEMSIKEIRRESFYSVPETCPAIDKAFDECIETVKDATERFRDSLIEWIERALEAEKKVEELESQVEDLEIELKEVMERYE